MANDKDFKVKNGIKPTAYYEAVGTVVSESEPYGLGSSVYDNVSLSVASQDTIPYSLFFKPDGTKAYVLGRANDTIYQYALSTAWDISTGSYESKSFSVASQEDQPNGMFFKPDGTVLYVAGTGGDDINQYSLSTAWDISTASYVKNFSLTSQTNNPNGIFFKDDGTKLYMGSDQNNDVFQYSLSTAWDIATLSYDSVSFSVNSEMGNLRDMFFKSDGTKMYVTGNTAIYQYSLSTAWDLSTAAYDSVSYTTSEESTPTDMFFKPDGTKMYVIGAGADSILQYTSLLNTATLDLSTGSVFEITPTSDIQVSLSNPADSGTVSGATLLLDGAAINSYNLSAAVYDSVSFSVTAQDTSPNEVFFKPDGTKMYILGGTNDTVFEYNLSTAWDVSSSSYVQSFSVASQESIPTGMFFKPDGTKMYIIGQAGDDVNEYTLSTAWNISTATYSQSFSISAQDTDPYAVTFSTDGTKMYIVGGVDDDIIEYDLSTAFDVSSASYLQAFSVAAQDTLPISVDFKSDGTKMFVLGRTNATVYEYDLSTAWDVSTSSYSKSFSVTSQEGSPNGLFFKPDGTSFYVVGSTSDTVYQYSVGSTATITYPTNITWPSGTAPTSPAIGETDVITFTTRDGGTTYNAALAIDGAT